MKGKLNSRKSGLLFAGLLMAVVITAGVALVSGQGSYSGTYAPSTPASASPAVSGSTTPVPSSTSSDRTYCVSMGFLYRTTPGVNGNQPICQFSDYSWCDANAFATGKCGPAVGATGFLNPYGIYYPYYYNYPYNNGYYYPGTPGEAIDACTGAGGNITSVHTPYGDVDVCKFPNGNIVDLYGMYNGLLGDNWYYYAYNYLNSP